MIWLIKKIIGVAVLIAIVFFVMNYEVGGRPVKELFKNFYSSPFAQEAVRQGRESFGHFLGSFLEKDPHGPASSAEPMEKIDDKDRQELEDVLKKK